jgi:hypothetical protein
LSSNSVADRRWPVGKVAEAAFLFGRGRSAKEIAEIIDAKPSTVSQQKANWGLRKYAPGRAKFVVPVELSVNTRSRLAQQAERVGCTPEELLARICSCAVQDDLYAAITDGKYD